MSLVLGSVRVKTTVPSWQPVINSATVSPAVLQAVVEHEPSRELFVHQNDAGVNSLVARSRAAPAEYVVVTLQGSNAQECFMP